MEDIGDMTELSQTWAQVAAKNLPKIKDKRLRLQAQKKNPTKKNPALLTDIGVNLCSKHFRNAQKILAHAYEQKVFKIISISNDVKDWNKNLDFCKKNTLMPKVRCTLGVHPHNASRANDTTMQRLRTLVAENRQYVAAVGECGLDYNRKFSPIETQQKCFESQVRMALELNLPLYFHERDAHDDFVKILKPYLDHPNFRGVLHCFTGGLKEMQTYLDMGLYIGITGYICNDKRSAHLQKIIHKIPLERLLIETDAPWMLPKNLPKPTPRYSEPAHVKYVAEKIAQLLGLKCVDGLIEITTKNAERLFGPKIV